MNASANKLLDVVGLAKKYGENLVLRSCTFDVRAGEIHALLGGNGAGKSTLVRLIAGLGEPASGEMSLFGRPYRPANKREAEAAGVEIVQQEFNLITTLSVAENLLLNRLPSFGGVVCQGQLRQQARRALDRIGLQQISPDAIVETLGVGQQQMVEIAGALDRECRLLILDEPTAALSAAEAERLFAWLERLRNEGVGIIYISHRLDEVARLSDRITILRDGNTIGTYDANELTTDGMVERMAGDQLDARQVLPTVERRPAGCDALPRFALQVKGLTGKSVQNVTFDVRSGERFGITGLVGSGRTELLRLIFGADVATAGEIFLGDDPTPRRFRHPRQAVAAGLAMVTEDRKKNGLLLGQPIRVNATLASLATWLSRKGLIRFQAEIAATEKTCGLLDTHYTGSEQTAGTLSGGNQQKVVIARWLNSDASLFLFDEPTRGIDVQARRRIYRLIETLAGEGKGIVIVSSDLEELLETCDRVAVMSRGKLVKTFERSSLTHDAVMQASFSEYHGREMPA